MRYSNTRVSWLFFSPTAQAAAVVGEPNAIPTDVGPAPPVDCVAPLTLLGTPPDEKFLTSPLPSLGTAATGVTPPLMRILVPGMLRRREVRHCSYQRARLSSRRSVRHSRKTESRRRGKSQCCGFRGEADPQGKTRDNSCSVAWPDVGSVYRSGERMESGRYGSSSVGMPG